MVGCTPAGMGYRCGLCPGDDVPSWMLGLCEEDENADVCLSAIGIWWVLISKLEGFHLGEVYADTQVYAVHWCL